MPKSTYKLKINGYDKPSNTYFRFNWDYCKQPPKDGVITKTKVGWHDCRDAGVASMRQDILSGKVKTDYTRMLFRWGIPSKANVKQAEDWVNRAVNILHVLERLGGWALTRVYKLETPDDSFVAYYFLSSRRWIKSSYLAYLYVLLVRMCADPWWGGHKNFTALKKAYKEKASSKEGFTRDSGYIKQSFPYWEAIVRGYPELFEKKKLEHYWAYERIHTASSNLSEGIDKLSRNRSEYDGLYENLKKLKNKFDKEANKK
jgi:hypothetical protein